MTANERLKQARQAVGLSQRKFAERITISHGHLSGMETGEKIITERIIRLVSREFGVDETWLRTGEGAMFDDEADVRVQNALGMFKSLDARFQKCALSQLSDLMELYNSRNE